MHIIAGVPQVFMLGPIPFRERSDLRNHENDSNVYTADNSLSVLPYYYPTNTNGKTNGNKVESLQTHCATYKTVFCCNFLENEFYMVTLC